MRLVLVRHGQTSWNKEGKFQGQSDVGLNELGLAQARQVAITLFSHTKPAALYSSPLPRALQTAGEISRVLDLPILELPGLKELSLGELEGITGPSMQERYPQVASEWHRNPAEMVFPGGESITQVQARAWNAVEEIESVHPDGEVVAVSHNFTIRATLCSYLDIPVSRFRMFAIDLGAITILETDRGSRQVITINERCHLSRNSSTAA